MVAVGNPFGFMGAVTTGVVHAVGRHPGLGPTKWIHADVQLAPGNSGGPLADARGNVVGVNTIIASGVGLAVPVNAVARLLAGDLPQAPLGVVVRPRRVHISGAERLGLAILEVVNGGGAKYASLRPGDTLVGIEGQPLRSLMTSNRRSTETEESACCICNSSGAIRTRFATWRYASVSPKLPWHRCAFWLTRRHPSRGRAW